MNTSKKLIMSSIMVSALVIGIASHTKMVRALGDKNGIIPITPPITRPITPPILPSPSIRPRPSVSPMPSASPRITNLLGE